MENEKPDNIVFSKDKGYNASILPYATNVGAPAIKMDDVVSWKNRGIRNVNREFENKFNELKSQYQHLSRSTSGTNWFTTRVFLLNRSLEKRITYTLATTA